MSGPVSGRRLMTPGERNALVCDQGRLRALELLGLGSDSDAEMERFAAWVRRALSVPTALVSLVQSDRQVFPGMTGLEGSFAAARSTPLSHSFCQHVVAASEPLVIGDARNDPRVADNLAVPDLGVVAYAGMPLTDDAGHVLGSLCAIDGRPRTWSDDELATLRDIARGCSVELRLRLARHDAGIEGRRRDRVERDQQRSLEHRTLVAHTMQDAMLTVLPTVEGLELAARYVPADVRENVGGDWYDAVPLTDPGWADGDLVAMSVGDIMGHDLPAITVMGQVRSMLRQSSWDHRGGPPSTIVDAFERANSGLGLRAAGTMVVAHLVRRDADRWLLRWTNAGHPPPILLRPDGTTELLEEHGPLFGFDLADDGRVDHERVLDPGSTLVLYTDGLVESVGADIDVNVEALRRATNGAAGGSPDSVADVAMALRPDRTRDDAVVFVIRVPPAAAPRP